MAGKKLAKDSKYAQYDTDGDGIVTDDEMAQAARMIEIENKDKKEDQLRQMAWVAMGSMVIFTVALFLPMLSVERLSALDNLLSMFYIAQAGVVGTYMGAQALASKK